MKKFVALCLIMSCVFSCTVFAENLMDENFVQEGVATPEESILIPLWELKLVNGTSAEPQHVLLEMPHTHRIHNVSLQSTRNHYEVLTAWADEGITISFTQGTSVTVSMSYSIESGVSLSEVSSALGLSVGASKQYTAETTYSTTVPEGKVGRLVYRVTISKYSFADEVTYYPPGIPNYSYSEVFSNNVAEGAPAKGVVYLELQDRDNFFGE